MHMNKTVACMKCSNDISNCFNGLFQKVPILKVDLRILQQNRHTMAFLAITVVTKAVATAPQSIVPLFPHYIEHVPLNAQEKISIPETTDNNSHRLKLRFDMFCCALRCKACEKEWATSMRRCNPCETASLPRETDSQAVSLLLDRHQLAKRRYTIDMIFRVLFKK